MKLAVIGTGYAGLVSGACIAERGHDVACLDVDPAKIERLNRGEMTIHEPGLEEIVSQNVARGRLRFTSKAEEAIPGADMIMLAVGTPPAPDGSADLTFLMSAVDALAFHADRESVVVTKSTVPVGTQMKIKEKLISLGRTDLAVASNPEMLREGKAVQDFLQPSRIVIGVDDPRARERLDRLYAPWDCRKFFMTPSSAELTKYAANAFLATKISFINEMAQLADAYGADINDVTRGVGSDPRIGESFLNAGLGWGGSCFPKDLSALAKLGSDRGLRLSVIAATQESNATIRKRVVEAVSALVGGLTGKRIALLGLAFKGGTDDTRSSPAIELLRLLLSAGATVHAYDPKAVLLGTDAAFTMRRETDPYAAAEGADAMIVATEWDEFRSLDLDRLKRAMRGDVLYDARNLLDADAVRRAGLRYQGIGRR
jgi:UDPglucose 6-dehydrogenase